MYNFQLATGAYRQVLKNFPYDNNEADSKLGVRVEPATIVDAAMRQMNEIGWMHNCRMIVANFLTKDLLESPVGRKVLLSEAD